MAGQRQTGGNVGTQSHGPPWGSRATECDRSKFHVTEGQVGIQQLGTEDVWLGEIASPPRTSLRSSGAGAGSASPSLWWFPCERPPDEMKRSTPTPISQMLPTATLAGASGSRFAVSPRRRSPLHRLDVRGGHECPLSTPCLPLERSRSAAGGPEKATSGLASTVRRDVCGDGLHRRVEEMRFRWIRGDRSYRYAPQFGGPRGPLTWKDAS